jgi:hypothetical protein
MTREQFNVRLPGFTLDCIDLLGETYGLTKTQTITLAVDRLTRDLNPEDATLRGRAAQTEALLLAQKGDDVDEVEQA